MLRFRLDYDCPSSNFPGLYCTRRWLPMATFIRVELVLVIRLSRTWTDYHFKGLGLVLAKIRRDGLTT
jgi:hypothetical protein